MAPLRLALTALVIAVLAPAVSSGSVASHRAQADTANIARHGDGLLKADPLAGMSFQEEGPATGDPTAIHRFAQNRDVRALVPGLSEFLGQQREGRALEQVTHGPRPSMVVEMQRLRPPPPHIGPGTSMKTAVALCGSMGMFALGIIWAAGIFGETAGVLRRLASFAMARDPEEITLRYALTPNPSPFALPRTAPPYWREDGATL